MFRIDISGVNDFQDLQTWNEYFLNRRFILQLFFDSPLVASVGKKGKGGICKTE